MILNINDDFDLYKIAYSGQCFRVTEKEGVYRFISGKHVLFVTEKSSTPSKITLDVSCSQDEWESFWADYFDINTNYSNIRSKIPNSDTFLIKSSGIGKGIRILNQDKFEMLISFIISQRKSIPAIKSSIEKLCRRFGDKIKCEDVLTGEEIYSFPAPSALSNASETELSECGLGYRLPYIRKASEMVDHGLINLDSYSQLEDNALREKLKELYGVGDKVANCICLFGYHRVGMAPIDTWIKKVIDEIYGGDNPFINYPDTAGIMQQYMFYASQHEKLLNPKIK